MKPAITQFASSLVAEGAFVVLAAAKRLKAAGKDIVELEIGDSPFDSPASAKAAGLKSINDNVSHYCPSLGLPEFRTAAARFVREEFGIPAEMENIAVAPGAKPFEQFFCETFLEANDGVLVFSPHFPTYPPNIHRRGARMVLKPLLQKHEFRPQLSDIESFLKDDPAPKAIFLNSPHNPTGGVTTQEDLKGIADLVRGTNIAVFSDEPYCHMVWDGQHHSLAAQPGMLEHTVAAYTFSKSYSMSGWRLGFCVSSAEIIQSIGLMINTTLSCTPPLVQLAGLAALENDGAERDRVMQQFRNKVKQLAAGLNQIDGVQTIDASASFYVFANVSSLCEKFKISSHGLAMYLLEGADDDFGVACLGGECFGDAGQGFLRFSCAEDDDTIQRAVEFLPTAFHKTERLKAWLKVHPEYQLFSG